MFGLLHFSLQILNILEMLRLVFEIFHETRVVAILSIFDIFNTFVIAQFFYRHNSIKTTITVTSSLNHLRTNCQHNYRHLFGLSFLRLVRAVFIREIHFTRQRLMVVLATSFNVHIQTGWIIFLWLYGGVLIGLQLLIKCISLLFH